jgi:protein involved in polysaccharide export with SLBB domain
MMKKTHNTAITGIASVCMVLLVAGCASMNMPSTYRGGSTPSTEFTLSAGDVIDIKFFYAPELNETQRIRPDGYISLQLVDDIQAENKTPAALSDEIERLYSGTLEKPEATVIVRALEHHSVYVGGAVNQPGRLDMPGRLDALSAIIKSGGFNLKEAQPRNVVVIRQENDARQAYVLDFSKTLNGHPDQTFYLHPQDIVWVPRADVVNVNQWIDQHITKMVPQFGLFYTRPLGDGTIGIDTSNR